ncbi:DMT family transporter [Guptibacillus algicola]|uniref:DMT family transporter n=1 Tax=Guptibacillus algicola TaxID=225844 RepID=UPI001CD7CF58|nr:DMT family transporter [Alkalihalobacillus algicola]MCA0987899.1 DMT family transporter [Alkalihalobacillus algicola]
MRLLLALLSLSLIWGMSFMFIKILVPVVGPMGVVFYRCLFGAVAILGYLIVKRRVSNLFNKLPWGSLILVGMLNALIPWGLIAFSEVRISSSLAAALNATTPLFTGILGALFFSRVLKARQLSGVIIGFIGILFLIEFDISSFFQEDWVGVVPMLIATACYGYASQFAKKNLAHVPVDIMAIMTLTVGAVGGMIIMLITGDAPSFTPIMERDILISLIGLGVFGSGIAYLLFFYMIQKGSAEYATLVTYLVPVTALFWGSAYLGEAVTLTMIVGLLFIFTGVYLSGRTTKTERNTLRKSA